MAIYYKGARDFIGSELKQLQNEEAADQAYFDFIKKCINAWFYRVCMTLDKDEDGVKILLYRYADQEAYYTRRAGLEGAYENLVVFEEWHWKPAGAELRSKIWKMTSMVVPIAPSTFTCEGPPIDDEHLMWVWKNLVSKS